MNERAYTLRILSIFLAVATTGPVLPHGCRDDGFVLRDYRPREIEITFPEDPVHTGGNVTVLEVPEALEAGVESLDIVLNTDSDNVRIDSIELNEIPGSSTVEPIHFDLEPDLEYPLYLEVSGLPEDSTKVTSLKIRIPAGDLYAIPGGKAMLEIFTNATQTVAGNEETCAGDLETGATSNWCSVGEVPTPKDGKFVIQIEIRRAEGLE